MLATLIICTALLCSINWSVVADTLEGGTAAATRSQEAAAMQRSQRFDKEIVVKSAFELLALALRHSAAIEVRSSLLYDGA